jgi:hypothetical protein
MRSLHANFEGRTGGWALLAAFAGRFIRPFTTSDSISPQDILASGHQLPMALTEFYSLCGNASDVWCRQDEWLKPAKVLQKNGVLGFWVENQGNWRIGIREAELTLEDPPVVWDGADCTYGIGTPGEFTVLTESVSKFALNMIAYVAKFFDPSFDRPFGYTFDVDQFLDVLGAAYDKCQLQREWVSGPECYFQDDDTFVEVNESDGFVYPILKTPAAVGRFCSVIERARFQWERAPAGG